MTQEVLIPQTDWFYDRVSKGHISYNTNQNKPKFGYDVDNYVSCKVSMEPDQIQSGYASRISCRSHTCQNMICLRKTIIHLYLAAGIG